MSFKRLRAHRISSDDERPAPQLPTKVLVKRKAQPDKPAELVELPPAAPKPAAKPKPMPKPAAKPKALPQLDALTAKDLLAMCKAKGLKATTKHTKAQLLKLLNG